MASHIARHTHQLAPMPLANTVIHGIETLATAIDVMAWRYCSGSKMPVSHTSSHTTVRAPAKLPSHTSAQFFSTGPKPWCPRMYEGMSMALLPVEKLGAQYHHQNQPQPGK